MCLGIAILAYSYSLIPNPIQRALILMCFLLLCSIMIVISSKMVVNNVYQGLLDRRKVNWTIPKVLKLEVLNLAKKMGVRLNQKKPIGIKIDYDNAYALPMTRQIVLGDKLLNTLGNEELLALFAHELTHLKEYHWLNSLLFTLYPALILAIPLRYIQAPCVFFNYVFYALFFVAFVVINWRNENSADSGAVKYAGRQATASLLRHLVPRGQWRRESETHPSIYSRIKRIRKISVC
jgi:Zn-dependent protease with chaperone function